jgi:cephalosporin hydroxylase/glycosyltransferase involved in cell wall biosynthesis
MYPFWEIAILPLLEASGAHRVVEIGALRGETTVLLLDRLGPDSEVHVIDPVPEFDPTEHERRFPGRYCFYRDISHAVLPTLPAVDVALIDGDHNWYTVYHELAMLSATAREAGEPLPLLIMHDVGWPYGRRDLYYAPERIPEEFRQPFAQRGMQVNRPDLLPPGRGGLNPTMNNAEREGGPRNGVMTALDDFVAGYDRPLRTVVLPLYFGLAVVAEEARLERTPGLAEALDRLESADVRNELLDLGESLRIRALTFQHGIYYGSQARFDRAADRYLDLLKSSLLDEHHLENEARLAYLAACVEGGQPPDPQKLHDPVRQLRREMRELQASRASGSPRSGDSLTFPYTGMGRHRLDHLQQCLATIRTESVDGDLADCGVQRGGGAIFMRGFLEAHEIRDRRVWVADPFRAPFAPGADESRPTNLRVDLNIVRDAFARFDLLDERVRFLQGAFADTLADAPIDKIALLRLDTTSADSTSQVLDALYGKVTTGGFVVVDDYANPEIQSEVDAFRDRHGVRDPLERIDWVGASWRKTSASAPPATRAIVGTPPSTGRGRAPLAPPVPQDRLALSVVVVFYNMRREAARTLHSLSSAYQRGVDDLDYEVIVVENGSDELEKLGDELVRSFGPQFRYVDLGSDATPSPADALNRGIAVARGEAIALMIDGAHVLTPGVLRFGMLGLQSYEPAMVVTQQWYVGPGQQSDAMLHGYDEEYEDRLFDEIAWPTDGYRLFDVGHFIGERDWFDGLWESNCVFVPRSLLEQAGGMDESFSMPGGGYANLDFYERIGSAPEVTVVSILGEGSFHQAHGGTTTNQPEMAKRNQRLVSYREHYVELRGRGFRGHGKSIHYVGHIFDGARRTRARRQTAPAFWRRAQGTGPDGFPEQPIPVPDELKAAFTDAFWRSLAWQETTWLGHRVANCPTDLLVYQELIARLRPDWIIETGTGDGGRALFLASVCGLLEHGEVLSIDERHGGEVPKHDRLTYVTGHPLSPKIVRHVAETVGESPTALVVLGSPGPKQRPLREFEAYAPFVPVGSYVVVERTIVNGHPVWPNFGLGPMEAVKDIVGTRRDFVADPLMERFALTFNPGGFLKRTE